LTHVVNHIISDIKDILYEILIAKRKGSRW